MATRTVQLTDEQIALLITSLGFSAREIQNYDYAPADPDWARTHRNEQLELISNTRAALKAASAAAD
jgi:hypothetical protein